ncbi:zinc finger protein 768-like isoform X2 [Palaemon carinicauda]|uniref:zinc finger protein 768-like isoform X2 n=1 Tax=Palaemon carinicauda TaxID=392227 RepID=UPI0035B5A24D
MTEGYLALRWNNHNTIFTKILTLLREQGEVHVPQSELGSLLRTAEGLQVKGLAVPDDSPRISSSNPIVPSVPSISRSHPPTLSAPAQTRKRKRPPETNRKDDPPKLTLRPDFGPPPSNRSRQRNRPPGMPELKRIKKDEHKAENTTLEPGEVPGSPSPAPSSHNSEEHPVNHTNKSKNERSEYVKREDDGDQEDDEGMPGEGMSADEPEDNEEEEEEDEEEEEEPGMGGEGESLSRSALSDVEDGYEQSNSSLPNSDISTTELLQVDLSEDGTQFIIGPGGFREMLSRGSPLTGNEERNGEKEKKPFVCPLCGQAFTRRDNLANHIKTHTGDRPFMCQYCHKCFSRKDYLKQHERIHTGEKPYACDICGRAFTRKEGLTDHMRCHSDFKAFSCETCGKSFKQKCGLRFHKRNYKH